MKRSELTISTLLIPLDYLALLGAAVVAYRLRYEEFATEVRPIRFRLPLADFLELAIPLALAWVVIFAIAGLYTATARRNWRAELSRVFLGCSTGFALVLAMMFFSRELFTSRFIMLAAWGLAVVFVSAVRLATRAVERGLFSRGIGVHRIALIGTGRAADALVAAFAARPSLGFRIVERVDVFSASAPNADASPPYHPPSEAQRSTSHGAQASADSAPSLLVDSGASPNGAEQRLAQRWARKEFDEIMDATTPPDPKRLHHLIDFANDHHIPMRFAADLLTAHTSRVSVETFAGVPLVAIQRTPLEGWGRVAKRAFDIVAATLLLIILSPLLALIALAVALGGHGFSPSVSGGGDEEGVVGGGVIFRQQRIGKAGRPFTFLKFRSMRVGAHAEWARMRKQSDRTGPVPKIKDDPRVTRVGRLLRRWSLDELPQLWNVLRGDMSLVGPRPHLPAEVADYERRHRKVLALRPGLTGLAQVSGRADLDFDEEAKVDTFYVEHWSLGLDVVILLRTPFAVVRARGAY